MYNKYEVKTYPECLQNELSDFEQDKKSILITHNNNVNNMSEQEKYLKNTFQPKFVFTNQNDNISFYQSTSKNSYRPSFNNNTISNSKNCLKNKKYEKNKKHTPTTQDYVYAEEKFSYNYSNSNTTFDTKNSNQSSQKNINIKEKRINLNEQYNKKKERDKKPQRTIKSCRKNNNQYNVQKSDNFNMLSFRPPEYDSDININKEKPKIIQIYKKQGVEEIFFPSKRTHSPDPQGKSSLNKKKNDRYQTNSLRHQSFFGSFNSLKHSIQTKSSSRIKINQLKDFNIDKLIEIGDKYVNMCKPILPLGKIMNDNIIYFGNRIKLNKSKIPINTNKSYNNNLHNEIKNIQNNSKFSKRYINPNVISGEIKQANYYIDNKDKSNRRVTKKIVCKKIMNNDDLGDEINVKKSLVFNNEENEYNDNKIKNDKINNTNAKIRKKQLKKSIKEIQRQKSCEKKIENQNRVEIIPENKIIKKKSNLNPKPNKNYFIERNNENNKLNINALNKTTSNNNKKIKTDISEPILYTDDEKFLRRNLKDQINKKNISLNKDILSDNQKYKNNKCLTKVLYKDKKTKNYYGYDDRQNLEETINNHVYYESVHSKKKNNNKSFENNI